MFRAFILTFIAGLTALASAAAAQQSGPRAGWFTSVEGAFVGQGSADLSGGGSFSVDRAYGRLGGLYRLSSGFSLGIVGSIGESDFDFSGGAPWGTIEERAITATFGGRLDNGARFFVAPSVRYRGETGADRDDSITYGVFAGASWDVSDTLTIGPGFGAFSELGNDDINFFPAIILDWQITDALSLTTGPTLGASEGPGLSLRYAFTDAWSLSLSGRYERNRFRLAGGGVGEDESIPVIVSLGYNPNPGINIAVFAGAEMNGTLRTENGSGTLISSQSYDAAPIYGLAVSFAF